ncbi:MAG TPA: thioesterase family protein [Polyangiaceae bacterium]|jgi:acyl-CoA thioester hydrolase|nr:thioesterase family protein [Polyangiaceae bacterium]
MNGVQEFPAHCVTNYRVRVRFGETDLMGIAHHGSYVAYLESARIEYLRRRNFNYSDMNDRGYHMPVVEMQLRYRKAARFDDEIIVETKLGTLTRVKVDFVYRLLRVNGAGEEVLAEGHTLLACVDKDHKPCALPNDVRELLFAPEIAE